VEIQFTLCTRHSNESLHHRRSKYKRSMLVFFFWFPQNLSNHMDRQACTCDTVLVERKMTGRSQTVPWWLGRGGGKDDRKQNTWARLVYVNHVPSPSSYCNGYGKKGDGISPHSFPSKQHILLNWTLPRM
jgi:hypothetical protein